MQFKQFIESQELFIPINKLYGWRPKMDEVYQDIINKRLSKTEGPIIVSRLDSPRGSFFMIDGYHRVVEAGLAGQQAVQASIDQYIPRIERTGGAYMSKLAEKEPMVNLIVRCQSA